MILTLAMFDSPLCDRQFTQFPLFSDWGQFDWLKIPLLAVPLLLAFFGLRWWLQHSRWRRQLNKPRGMLLLSSVTVILLLLLAVADQGLVLFLPVDSGKTVQAIVVLGRGTELGIPRIDVAAELWKAKRAPLIFVSGTWDASKMLPLLEKKGIPKQALDGEDCSLTTPENALFSATILQARGIQQILLVTDGLHLWRSLLDFRSQGLSVIPHRSPLPQTISFVDKAFLTFREYLFLFTSGIYELFQGQRIPNVDNPELINLLQKAEQYGQQQRFR